MVIKTNLFLTMIACISMSIGMHASQSSTIVENQWPDGRECFQDIITEKMPKLRSIVDAAPAGFNKVHNVLWQKYICPAASHNAQFPLQITDTKNEEPLWKSKDGSLALIKADVLKKNLIDTATKKVLLPEERDDGEYEYASYAFSPDDRFVAYNNYERIKVLELPSLNECLNIPISDESYSEINFSNNGKFLITQRVNGQGVKHTEVIDLHNLEDSWNFQGAIVESPDGASLYKFDNNLPDIEKYDIATRTKRYVKTLRHNVHNITISAQGNYMAGYYQSESRQVMTCIFDAITGDPIFEVEGYGEFLGEYFLARKGVDSTLYRLSDHHEMFKQKDAGYCYSRYIHYSNDGQFRIVVNNEGATLIDLNNTRTTIDGDYFVLSPDSKYLAYITVLKSLWGNVKKANINIMSLKTKKVCAQVQLNSENGNATALEFSSVAPILKVIDDSRFDEQKDILIDLTVLENPAIQKIFNNELTLEQFMLLTYLADIKQKKGDKPISLLADIAKPRVLILHELQNILASFPAEIKDAIINSYNITDATGIPSQGRFTRLLRLAMGPRAANMIYGNQNKMEN